MDEVISNLQAKLEALKTSKPSHESLKANKEDFKLVLNNLEKKASLEKKVVEKKAVKQESDQPVLVNGKEEFTIEKEEFTIEFK